MIAVIVLDGNVIKNKIIHVDEPINNENLLKTQHASEHNT